jgi:hypothetical protein
VSQATFAEVERAFPYMVAREFASGGGDVRVSQYNALVTTTFIPFVSQIPEFKWHIFEDKVPIDVADSGILITPFEGRTVALLPGFFFNFNMEWNVVQHGRLGAASAPPGFAPTPTTSPSTTPERPSTPKINPASSLLVPPAPPIVSQHPAPASVNDGHGTPALHPYLCHAFKIQDSVIYLSDVSWISEESWEILNQPSKGDPSHQYAVAIVDCLRPLGHISHFGIREAVNVARRINAQRTYLTGFAHEVSHDEYVTVGEYVGGKAVDNPTEKEKKCIDVIDEGRRIWVRPSHDGLRFEVSRSGIVRDNSYDC